ncbi:MAG TPA: sulfite exporter TauE/SafE family protein [Planktothrix sp.]
MTITAIVLFALIGLLAGSLSGLLGIGGGVVIVPCLVFLLGFNEHLAQGTTLALMVPPIGLLAAWHYYRNGQVNLRVAALICLGFVFGGLLGARLALILSNHALEKVFGFGLALIAVKMLTSHPQEEEADAGKTYSQMKLSTGILFIVLGLTAGAVSGLIGIGGGVIVVPALVFLFGMSQHRAQGTTLALMVPPCGLLAAWQYFRQGNVDVHAGIVICVGFFLGGFLGAKLAGHMSNRIMARFFGCSMLVIAIKMLLA